MYSRKLKGDQIDMGFCLAIRVCLTIPCSAELLVSLGAYSLYLCFVVKYFNQNGQLGTGTENLGGDVINSNST